jgi:MoxR-like ATPase
MGYPTLDEEIRIVESRRDRDPLKTVKPAVNVQLICFLRALVSDVRIDPEIYRYLVTLISATRTHNCVALGASPRASLALKRLCQAYAFMHSRNYVIPEDVSDIFRVSVGHRLVLRQEAKLRQITCDTVLNEILQSIPVPYKGRR